MARNVTRIENLIKKLKKAEFCKVFSFTIRSRLANEPESTIAEASISTTALTPVRTPAPIPAANSDQDHGKTSEVHRASSGEPDLSPQDCEPSRKRSEQADPVASDEANFDDCCCCQGHRKRRKHDSTLTRGNSGLVKANMIKPDPGEDLYNFWALCKAPRNSGREQELIQPRFPWAEQLPRLFDNAEKRCLDANSKSALNTLEWRLLAIDVAKMYVVETPNEDVRWTSWRAMGHKVHGARDTTLDLLTGRIFGADEHVQATR